MYICKECPDGMYGYLCAHFQIDPSTGIGWNTSLTLWLESNPLPRSCSKASAELLLELDCDEYDLFTSQLLVYSIKNTNLIQITKIFY